jgi:hypothetical protein
MFVALLTESSLIEMKESTRTFCPAMNFFRARPPHRRPLSVSESENVEQELNDDGRRGR